MLTKRAAIKNYPCADRIFFYEDNFSGDASDFWYYLMFVELIIDGYVDEKFIDGKIEESETPGTEYGGEDPLQGSYSYRSKSFWVKKLLDR